MSGRTVFNIVCYSILILSIIIVSCVFAGYSKKKTKEINKLKNEIEYYKKAANPCKESIDSLNNDIQQRDSIIEHIKLDYKYDLENIKNMSDSATIALFKDFVWAN